jgi:two-component sensor histidine kinase
VDPVRAVASELAANAIVHARTPFTVTLSRTGRVVLLRVEDAAVESPIRRSVQLMAEGGYGLNLVASLSRAWGVTTAAANDDKCVWAEFDVRPHGDRGWS